MDALTTTKPPETPAKTEPEFNNYIPQESEVKEALARIKAEPMASRFMEDVALVGKYSRSKGLKDSVRGIAIQALAAIHFQMGELEFLRKIYRERLGRKRKSNEDIRGLQNVVSGMRELTEAMTPHLKTLMSSEGTLAHLPTDGDDAPPVNGSFKPGQAVGPGTTIFAQNVNMGEPPKVEPTK